MGYRLTKADAKRLADDPIGDGRLRAAEVRRDGTGGYRFVLRSVPALEGHDVDFDDALQYLDVPKGELTKAINAGRITQVAPGRLRAADVRSFLPGAAVCTRDEALAVLERSRDWLIHNQRLYGIHSYPVGQAGRYSKRDVNDAAARLRRREGRAD